MTFGAYLAAFLISVTADGVTGHVAAQTSAHETLLAAHPTVVQAQLIGSATIEIFSTHYLWTHQHRRIAVAVLVGSTIAHGLASAQNLRAAQQMRQR